MFGHLSFYAITGLDLFLGLPKEEFYRAARLRDLYYSTSIMQQMKYIYSIFSDPLTRTAAMKYAGGPDSLAQRAMLPDSDVILSAVSNRATLSIRALSTVSRGIMSI